MSNIDELMNQVAGTAPQQARYPFIGPGEHELELTNYMVRAKGVKVTIVAELLVVSSTGAHPVGSKVCTLFKLTGHAEEFQQVQDHARANAFQRALLGKFLLGDKPTQADLVAAGNALRTPEQKGRGLRVLASGHKLPPNTKKDGTPAKPWTEITFSEIPGQTPESVRANRLKQDTAHAPAEKVAAQAAPVTTLMMQALQPEVAVPDRVIPAIAGGFLSKLL